MILKQLKKCLESEKKREKIFDIIVYGSFVKGKSKPNDIDIVVIFLEGSLKERLDIIQQIKLKIKLEFPIDIKQILLTDLFSSDFFARSGILLEGVSLFSGKKLCEQLGFKASTLFWYALEGLTHTEKVTFNYAIAGRGTSSGILKEFDGIRLVNGAVKIPIEKSLEFEEVFKLHKITYHKKNILEEY